MAEVKSAHEWLKDPRVQDRPGQVIRITDDDGWRKQDGVRMEDPIPWDDFIARFNQSTIMSYPEDAESHQTPA